MNVLYRLRAALTAPPPREWEPLPVAPSRRFDRARAGRRLPRGARGFAAASQNRLTENFEDTVATLDNLLRGGNLRRLRQRSRELEKNNEYAKGVFSLIARQVVGDAGFKLQMEARGADGQKDAQANRAVELAWRDFSRPMRCETTGKMGMAQFQRYLHYLLAVDGELLLQLVPGYSNRDGFAVRVLDPDLIDETYNGELPDGRVVRMGVELDDWGKPQAYYLREHRMDGVLGFRVGERRRVEASALLHYFSPQAAVQTRGFPWIHAALLKLHRLGSFEEAELIASLVEACKMLVITKEEDEDFLGDRTEAGGDASSASADGPPGPQVMDTAPGQVLTITQGQKADAYNPTHPNMGVEVFTRTMLRGFAVSMGFSYHSVSGDYSSVNYSAGKLSDRVEKVSLYSLQDDFGGGVLTPICLAWLRVQLTLGRIAVEGGGKLRLSNLEKYENFFFRGPALPSPDPLKDAQAENIKVGNGSKLLRTVVEEGGEDFDEHVEAYAAELERCRELGIPHPGLAKASGLAAGGDVAGAVKWLEAAIARHQRHMDGTEATDQASQQKMMDEMKAALAALTGGVETTGSSMPEEME